MASSSPRVSLREIAEKAGVTRMTVSLALRGSPAISQKTRDKIIAIARTLGHRPDPVVSSLMADLRRATRTQNVATIAMITNQRGDLSWRDIATHRAYFEGAREQADMHGFRLEEFRLFQRGMSERRLTEIMWSRGIAGAIVFPILNRAGAVDLKLDLSRFSSATIGYSLRTPSLHRSCVHHFRVAMDACVQLRKLGYHRLGLVLDENQDRRSGRNWRGGFLAAEHLAGGSVVPLLIEKELTEEKFRWWFNAQRPDAIVHLAGDNDGEGPIFDWLKRCGARVPRDVGYASLDLAPSMTNISGMDQMSKLVGASAVDLVVLGLRQHELGEPKHPRLVMTEGVWCARSTTRPQSPAAG